MHLGKGLYLFSNGTVCVQSNQPPDEGEVLARSRLILAEVSVFDWGFGKKFGDIIILIFRNRSQWRRSWDAIRGVVVNIEGLYEKELNEIKQTADSAKVQVMCREFDEPRNTLFAEPSNTNSTQALETADLAKTTEVPGANSVKVSAETIVEPVASPKEAELTLADEVPNPITFITSTFSTPGSAELTFSDSPTTSSVRSPKTPNLSLFALCQKNQSVTGKFSREYIARLNHLALPTKTVVLRGTIGLEACGSYCVFVRQKRSDAGQITRDGTISLLDNELAVLLLKNVDFASSVDVKDTVTALRKILRKQ
jgi:hypothetical protein